MALALEPEWHRLRAAASKARSVVAAAARSAAAPPTPESARQQRAPANTAARHGGPIAVHHARVHCRGGDLWLQREKVGAALTTPTEWVAAAS